MDVEHEPGTFWMQPNGCYVELAMEQLRLGPADIEEVEPADSNIMIGDYPTLDRVFQRAWELADLEG